MAEVDKKSPSDTDMKLSRREREILDVIFALGKATATDVLREMNDPPSRTAVRTFLRIMEEKGHLTHTVSGREYVYRARHPRGPVGKSAMRRVLDVFYDGSVEKALAAHLSDPSSHPGKEELDRLSKLIENARKQGK